MSLAFFPSTVRGVTMVVATSHATPTRMFHEWYSVPLNFSGSAPLNYRRQAVESRPNQVAVLEPGEVHYNRVVRSPLDCAVANIDARLLEQTARDLGYRGTPHFRVDHDATPPSVAEAAKDFACKSRATAEIADASFTHLVAQLLEHYSEQGLAPPTQTCSRALETLLEAARFGGYCPTMAELAIVQGTTERQLFRQFRTRFGTSPYEIYQLARVTREHEHSVARLATKFGFADQSHMNRLFRRVVGSPAGTLARQMRTTDFCSGVIDSRRRRLEHGL